ncbi:MAG: tRNA (adenosine(37)-N6)-threonylcarbamoyltransferase complex dimerization subunit type 1 TsaB [Chlamydiae bacterium]|nr:tRNA (adenosine(37)-N6)-threonylcarbamoyltransferase complex dimerization subunit type 1 TsaB [Chlamydiota bacterium]MBI3277043.1 tRNA (adenosine(37)-N6)-threonylcarbamoyltransferase complex dimerization subunit type 1 TsaB [Chlamydiota bacterium]
MKILGIETSTRIGSFSLVDGKSVLAESIISENLRHSGDFERALKNLFDPSKLKSSDLDAIAVGLGPGSFTGIRIGLTIGTALSFSLQKPLFGLGTLEVLAHQVEFPHSKICPIISAEAGEVYGAVFKKKNKNLEKTKEEFMITIPGLKEVVGPSVFLFGPGLERDRLLIEKIFGVKSVDAHIIFPLARGVAFLAQDPIWRCEGEAVIPRYVKPLAVKPG